MTTAALTRKDKAKLASDDAGLDDLLIAGFQDRNRDYTKAFRRIGMWG
jgi:hypothetical protein